MRNDSLSTWEGRHGPQKPTEDKKQKGKSCTPYLCPILHFKVKKYHWRLMEVIGKMYSFVLRGARQPHKALEAPHTYIPGKARDPGG